MNEARKATKSDIELIRRLALSAFPATYAEILSPEQLEYMLDWMYSPKSLEAQFDGGHVFYIGYCDGEPYGYVSVRPEGEDLFHLEKIYILKEFQGRGLGGFLFETAKRHIKNIHPAPCKMHLNVNRNNRALGFYKKMGMEIAQSGDFPIGNGYYMNDYIMELKL